MALSAEVLEMQRSMSGPQIGNKIVPGPPAPRARTAAAKPAPGGMMPQAPVPAVGAVKKAVPGASPSPMTAAVAAPGNLLGELFGTMKGPATKFTGSTEEEHEAYLAAKYPHPGLGGLTGSAPGSMTTSAVQGGATPGASPLADVLFKGRSGEAPQMPLNKSMTGTKPMQGQQPARMLDAMQGGRPGAGGVSIADAVSGGASQPGQPAGGLWDRLFGGSTEEEHDAFLAEKYPRAGAGTGAFLPAAGQPAAISDVLKGFAGASANGGRPGLPPGAGGGSVADVVSGGASQPTRPGQPESLWQGLLGGGTASPPANDGAMWDRLFASRPSAQQPASPIPPGGSMLSSRLPGRGASPQQSGQSIYDLLFAGSGATPY